MDIADELSAAFYAGANVIFYMVAIIIGICAFFMPYFAAVEYLGRPFIRSMNGKGRPQNREQDDAEGHEAGMFVLVLSVCTAAVDFCLHDDNESRALVFERPWVRVPLLIARLQVEAIFLVAILLGLASIDKLFVRKKLGGSSERITESDTKSQ